MTRTDPPNAAKGRALLAAKMSNRPCSQCGAPRAFIDGAWLREERKKAGLSLREVAKRLGFTASYICDIELNRRNANPALAKRFLAKLEAPE